MATAMVMRFPGITPEIYDEAREKIGWERDPADGGLFHAAGWDDGVLRVFDVWESPAHFQRFTEERLAPGLKAMGVDAQPEVELYEIHRLFQPAPLPV
jgi:hypothetical protein